MIFEISLGMHILYMTIGIAVLLLAFFAITFLVVKKKGAKTVINEPFIEALILNLGGKENIVTTDVLEGRLKITVNDLDLVKLEEIKTISEGGVFVTGNTIKVLFKENSELIKKALDK